jgi:hypothetical protein
MRSSETSLIFTTQLLLPRFFNSTGEIIGRMMNIVSSYVSSLKQINGSLDYRTATILWLEDAERLKQGYVAETLRMEVIPSSETSGHIRTTRCYYFYFYFIT